MPLLTVSKRNHPAVQFGDVTFSLNMPENNNWMDWQGRWWLDFGGQEIWGHFEQETAPPENMPNEAVRLLCLALVVSTVIEKAPEINPMFMLWVMVNLPSLLAKLDEMKQEYMRLCQE